VVSSRLRRRSLDLIDLAPDQTLLVTGAAGAVGGYLVELAAARGLHVVALAADADEQEVRRLGARTFVARSADPAAAVRAVFPDGVDGVIDPADLRSAIFGAVREGGKYVTSRRRSARSRPSPASRCSCRPFVVTRRCWPSSPGRSTPAR
jgi:NADPH:quinone reductase-like Zn-dependent oxidoreductase